MVTINGSTVTVTYQDGGAGDHDLTADGTITDPADPAFVASSASAPESSSSGCFIATLINDGGVYGAGTALLILPLIGAVA